MKVIKAAWLPLILAIVASVAVSLLGVHNLALHFLLGIPFGLWIVSRLPLDY